MDIKVAQGDTGACVRRQLCTSAEINQLAACPEGNLLAAADDDGHVTIVTPSDQGFTCQALNGQHGNVCSSVLFQQHKANQGLTHIHHCRHQLLVTAYPYSKPVIDLTLSSACDTMHALIRIPLCASDAPPLHSSAWCRADLWQWPCCTLSRTSDLTIALKPRVHLSPQWLLVQQDADGHACLCCSDIWRFGLQTNALGCAFQKHTEHKTSR